MGAAEELGRVTCPRTWVVPRTTSHVVSRPRYGAIASVNVAPVEKRSPAMYSAPSCPSTSPISMSRHVNRRTSLMRRNPPITLRAITMRSELKQNKNSGESRNGRLVKKVAAAVCCRARTFCHWRISAKSPRTTAPAPSNRWPNRKLQRHPASRRPHDTLPAEFVTEALQHDLEPTSMPVRRRSRHCENLRRRAHHSDEMLAQAQ